MRRIATFGDCRSHAWSHALHGVLLYRGAEALEPKGGVYTRFDSQFPCPQTQAATSHMDTEEPGTQKPIDCGCIEGVEGPLEGGSA